MADQDVMARETADPKEGSSSNQVMQHWKLWYLVGIASVGLTVGFFAGNSASPVVSTLLPLLFTLIAGGGGTYLLRQDLQAPRAPERMRVLGIAIFLFCSCALLAGAIGIAIRADIGLNRFVPHWSGPPDHSAILKVDDAEQQLKLLMLRRKLQALDASESEQTAIVKGFVPRVDEGQLRKNLEEALSNCNAAAVDARRLGETNKDALQNLAGYLRFLDATCAKLAVWKSFSDPLSIGAFRKELEDILRDAVGFDYYDYGVDSLNSKNLPSAIQPSWQRVRIALLRIDASLSRPWTPDGDLDHDLDATISITRLGAGRPSLPTEEIPPAAAAGKAGKSAGKE